MLGERPEDCIDNPEVWDRWLDPRDADWVRAECERTNDTGEPFAAEYRARTRDGQLRWVRDEAFLVRDVLGRPRFWQGILTDVTAAHELTERLASALQHEQDAADQLGVPWSASRPPAAIAGPGRDQDDLPAGRLPRPTHPIDHRAGYRPDPGAGAAILPAHEVNDLLGRLTANARKLGRLLTTCRTWTASPAAPSPWTASPSTWTRSCDVVAEAELPTDHTLVVETTTLEVVLDPAKVERIVENLIVNAARHTPAGTTIWVRVTDQPDGVLLEIDDDGPGSQPRTGS